MIGTEMPHPSSQQSGNRAQRLLGRLPRRAGAPGRAGPDLDYLTLDYLAEVSMSILAKQRERDPNAGYARDFIEVVALACARSGKRADKLQARHQRRRLEPARLRRAAARKSCATPGCEHLKIGIVSGDDVLPLLRTTTIPTTFAHLETGEPLRHHRRRSSPPTPISARRRSSRRFEQGADIVITGRVADPSLTVAPCIAHFGWSTDDYDAIAGATVAGHLIECGTQVTGGISTDWLSLPDNLRHRLSRSRRFPQTDRASSPSRPAPAAGSANRR